MLLLPLRRSRAGSGTLWKMQVAARALGAVAPGDSGGLLRVRADAFEKARPDGLRGPSNTCGAGSVARASRRSHRVLDCCDAAFDHRSGCLCTLTYAFSRKREVSSTEMLNGASVADSRCRCPERRGRDLSAGQSQSTPPAWLRNWRRVRFGPWASAPRTLALPARWAASGCRRLSMRMSASRSFRTPSDVADLSGSGHRAVRHT
jgi:hypothetical protein